MKIGIDARPVFVKSSRRRGIGKFSLQLIEALLGVDSSLEYLFYTLSGTRLGLPGRYFERPLFQIRRPARVNWMLDAGRLGRRLRKDSLALFHALDFTSVPARRNIPVIATVHDMIPFVFWERTCKVQPWDYRQGLKRARRNLRRLDRIVTISEHSKRDIVRLGDVHPEKVVVMPPGCNPSLAPVDLNRARRSLSETYGIRGSFLFYVGGTDFRKNLLVLIEAFSRFRADGFGGKLVLAGETFHWSIPETDEIRRTVQRLNLDDEVVCPGYVPDSDLPNFFSACHSLVFPSLYEGFGLPVLEAMRCGAPVLAGETSSVPEVGGDAALYFDPTSVDSMVSALHRLENESDLRAELIDRGFVRAARFSWPETGRRLVRLYEELVA